MVPKIKFNIVFIGNVQMPHYFCVVVLFFFKWEVNPSFPNPRRRLRLRDLAERVIDAQENEQELNKLLNEALLERETVQA